MHLNLEPGSLREYFYKLYNLFRRAFTIKWNVFNENFKLLRNVFSERTDLRVQDLNIIAYEMKILK